MVVKFPAEHSVFHCCSGCRFPSEHCFIVVVVVAFPAEHSVFHCCGGCSVPDWTFCGHPGYAVVHCQMQSTGWVSFDDDCLCSATLHSRTDPLRSHLILHEWLAFYSAFLNIHRSGILTMLPWLVPHGTAAVSAQVLCTPYNHAPCHFTQSRIRKMNACLAVTCHLHFWQNDRDLLRGTAVTRLVSWCFEPSQPHTVKSWRLTQQDQRVCLCAEFFCFF